MATFQRSRASGRVTRKRRAGRPPTRGSNAISKEAVVRCALRLCKREPLQTISIVRVAAELNVTPALIHYYVGGRDRLTSGVMNRFYDVLVRKLPRLVSNWRADLKAVFDVIYFTYLDFSGVVAYVMSHNRFRLFQLVDEQEQDNGIRFFERVVASVRQAGLSAKHTAMFTHLLLQHVLASAYQHASRQLPEDHNEFLAARMKSVNPSATPHTHFIAHSFSALRGDDAYQAGLRFLLDAINSELRKEIS